MPNLANQRLIQISIGVGSGRERVDQVVHTLHVHTTPRQTNEGTRAMRALAERNIKHTFDEFRGSRVVICLGDEQSDAVCFGVLPAERKVSQYEWLPTARKLLKDRTRESHCVARALAYLVLISKRLFASASRNDRGKERNKKKKIKRSSTENRTVCVHVCMRTYAHTVCTCMHCMQGLFSVAGRRRPELFLPRVQFVPEHTLLPSNT